MQVAGIGEEHGHFQAMNLRCLACEPGLPAGGCWYTGSIAVINIISCCVEKGSSFKISLWYHKAMITPLHTKAQPAYRAVLFDLDGTLTDPYEGITRTIRYACTGVGRPAPPDQQLRDWIGPPLRSSFVAYFGDEQLADQAVALYRARYRDEGAFENRLYPGIVGLLDELRDAGVRLFLATSKYQPAAELILNHFGLTAYFSAIVGSTGDGRIEAKADVIGALLPQLSDEERAAGIMVGDREHDVFGARNHGLPCIGVSYGYGGEEELLLAGAALVVPSVTALREALFAGG